MLQKSFSEDMTRNKSLIDKANGKKICHCYTYVFGQEEKMLIAQQHTISGTIVLCFKHTICLNI